MYEQFVGKVDIQEISLCAKGLTRRRKWRKDSEYNGQDVNNGLQSTMKENKAEDQGIHSVALEGYAFPVRLNVGL